MDKLEKIGTKMAIIVTLAGLLFGVLLYYNAIALRWRQTIMLYQTAYNSLGLGIFYRGQDSITVYIRENGVWEPFLVLEARYPGEGNGGTLLLRRYLIQERRPWIARENRRDARLGHGGKDFRYYPMSDIDAWLESEYIQMFSSSIQDRILTANIEVWDGWNHGQPGAVQNITVTEIVPRRIFLLSENETGWVGMRGRRAEEGLPIAYFNPGLRYGNLRTRERLKFTRRAATPRHEYTGELRHPERSRESVNYSWWLRSVRWTQATGTIATISGLGMSNQLGLSNYTFVRPAFTLPRDTIIELYEINGRLVYVIHE